MESPALLEPLRVLLARSQTPLGGIVASAMAATGRFATLTGEESCRTCLAAPALEPSAPAGQTTRGEDSVATVVADTIPTSIAEFKRKGVTCGGVKLRRSRGHGGAKFGCAVQLLAEVSGDTKPLSMQPSREGAVADETDRVSNATELPASILIVGAASLALSPCKPDIEADTESEKVLEAEEGVGIAKKFCSVEFGCGAKD